MQNPCGAPSVRLNHGLAAPKRTDVGEQPPPIFTPAGRPRRGMCDLIRGPDRAADRRTAQEYSNAVGHERLRQAPAERMTYPNDHQTPRRREFASRGAN